ncbi:MAG: ribonuclease III [Lachnospiraceae bacterium]|nr:ribonuclease III [Lachnospiraceae bacterium]
MGESVMDERRIEARNYSPLVLAFLGDSVYEREIRERIVREGNAAPAKLNRRSSELAKAATQATIVRLILEDLTEEEAAIYRRGRNANSHTMAKNATMSDYRMATGFEALMGYLFLAGDEARYKELIELGLSRLSEQTAKL